MFRLHALYVVNISTDSTWDNPGSVIWSAIELNVGILCASLPTLRAFFIKIWPRVFGVSFGTRRAAAGTDTAKGQYYNMEGSIMVKKTVAIQNSSEEEEGNARQTQFPPTGRKGPKIRQSTSEPQYQLSVLPRC